MTLPVNPILAAVADATTPNAGFTQSVAEIQAYSQYMATVGMTGDPAIDGTLTTAKTNAAQWYNSIYPTYLDMPATISAKGSDITSGLSLLTQLAGQYASSPTDAIRAAINSEAASLQATVGDLGSQAQALDGALATFASDLQSDTAGLQSAANTAAQQITALQQQLATEYGTLQHLQNAACPSKSDITACEQTISATQSQITAAQSAQNVASEAAQGAVNAGSGLGYLAGYWGAVAQDAAQCVAALAKLQTDPGDVLQMDLATTEQLWAALEAQFQALATQLTAAR